MPSLHLTGSTGDTSETLSPSLSLSPLAARGVLIEVII